MIGENFFECFLHKFENYRVAREGFSLVSQYAPSTTSEVYLTAEQRLAEAKQALESAFIQAVQHYAGGGALMNTNQDGERIK